MPVQFAYKAVQAFYGMQVSVIPKNDTEQLQGPPVDTGINVGATPLPPSSIQGSYTDGFLHDTVSDFQMGSSTHSIVEQLGMQQTVDSLFQHVLNQGGVVARLDITQTVSASLIKSPLNQTVADAITVAQTIGQNRLKIDTDAVAVAQVITIGRDSVKNVVDTLTMTQYINAWKADYHWINPGISAPSTASTFKLAYSSTTLELRNPKFSDKDSYEAQRIYRVTRGGNLEVYRDPMWPDQEILSVEFEYLSSTQAADLLDFFHNSLGHKITLTDQYNRQWDGYILTPESEIIQSKRIGYGAKFDFQGTLQ